MTSNVAIKIVSGYSDCEDCGSYDWERAVVEKDGETILEHSGDNHLAGGLWYDWEQAVFEILSALGCTVEIVREVDEGL